MEEMLQLVSSDENLLTVVQSIWSQMTIWSFLGVQSVSLITGNLYISFLILLLFVPYIFPPFADSD